MGVRPAVPPRCDRIADGLWGAWGGVSLLGKAQAPKVTGSGAYAMAAGAASAQHESQIATAEVGEVGEDGVECGVVGDAHPLRQRGGHLIDAGGRDVLSA
ncbi:MAG: hypothetical protein BWZ07_01888 [Alphaproteobacteria bacterium ADurb.BinA280]|nr:MAG: hypothetical protein BWZ07_01888 [Alphaproteobacteria bacterium ADurb.BinA280]